MVDDVIIMAGGSGTRLWPASIRSRPKQFMDPGLGSSLLEATIRRAAALEASGRIVIVAHADHVPAIAEECGGLPEELRERISVLGEPEAKNTAPAIALSMAYLRGGRDDLGRAPGARESAGGRTALVLAADHLITPVELFRDAVEAADGLAREGYLVTFGVTPTRPETGYGYIEAGEAHGAGNLVAAFREKPDRDTAEQYYASGRHFWNSGMFVFEADSFARELSEHAPEVAETMEGLADAAFAGRAESGVHIAGDRSALAAAYRRTSKISIDYALMERSAHVAMVPAGFTWNDVGSWDEIAALSRRGVLDPGSAAAASAHEGGAPTIEVNAEGNFVFSEVPVALAGVKDLLVVVKNGRVLITKRGESQLVKQVVEQLETRGLIDIS
jgi:mannose-1-phosphate guanylyltransferase/mannose-1-phosphate guanylyltransferase/mannose-6-phosphate isomerase